MWCDFVDQHDGELYFILAIYVNNWQSKGISSILLYVRMFILWQSAMLLKLANTWVEHLWKLTGSSKNFIEMNIFWCRLYNRLIMFAFSSSAYKTNGHF